MSARRRKQHSLHEHKCPYCVKPKKWCKNLSGLTQHINSKHIDILRAPSPVRDPTPTPSTAPVNDDSDTTLLDPENARIPSHLPAEEFSHPSPLDPSPAQDHTPGARECHPLLNGRPCDTAGNDLPQGSPPPSRTDAVFGDWSPFANRVEFELAEFLFKKEQMPQSNINILLDLWAADVVRYGGRPPFADYSDLYKTIDMIGIGDVPWSCLRVSYNGPRPEEDVPSWMDEVYEVWMRDPRLVSLKMLANPEFHGSFDVAPYREFTGSGDRQYGNLMSANWAWKQADAVSREVANSDGAMLVSQIFGSDKTTVSVATGQNDFYPLYMSLGNLHNGARRAHRDSILPIAFLAIPKAERRHADTAAFRRFRRQLFHTSLAAILQPLKPGMSTPEVVRCPDGHFRRAVWALGPYIADYPEQVLVANIVQGWCPACLKYPTKLDTDEPGQRRARVHTEALLWTFEPASLWHDYGVVADVTPFTEEFPRADINELLSGDLLHQIIKGTFKDHLVTWVGQYLLHTHGESRGKELLDEIDCRIASTPPFPGLRHFKQGRDFKQWTGDDSKALMKVYLPAISGIVPSEIVRTLAVFLEFCYLARRSHLTDTTLSQMDDARQRFNKHRQIFKSSGVRPDGFSLPRQHSLEHYLQHIRNFGAPNSLCSSMTEAKHIKAVKEPWRRSNRYEALGQMLLTNQRIEKLSDARVDFTARGMMTGTCSEGSRGATHGDVLAHTDMDVDADANMGDSDAGDGLAGVVPGERVSGFVVLARKPQPRYPPLVEDLALHINVPMLPSLLGRFLYEQAHPDSSLSLGLDINPPPCPPGRIRVFHSAVSVFYAPSDPSGLGGMHREHIRVTPSWHKGPARYDCVFLGNDPNAPGFQSLHVARTRLLFSFQPDPKHTPPGLSIAEVPCALVEWFSPIGNEPDEETGLWMVQPDLADDGSRELGVVHIDTVLRSAHLIPAFGDDPIPPHLKASDALDSFQAYYVNKYADHHAHEIAF
ncbi:hypothetical protein C8Q79DRAFT_906496 [Trametes meyenii]|nr:hypothetical protein C8Q79DRAFT_906496 [Trametes meyenii]